MPIALRDERDLMAAPGAEGEPASLIAPGNGAEGKEARVAASFEHRSFEAPISICRR